MKQLQEAGNGNVPSKERGTKIAAWVSTGLFVLIMPILGVLYEVRAAAVVASTRSLGYPDYVIPILGTAKLLGVVGILLPRSPRLQEWFYAGFTFIIILTFLSHVLSRDTLGNTFHPVFVGGLLLVSCLSRRHIAAKDEQFVSTTVFA